MSVIIKFPCDELLLPTETETDTDRIQAARRRLVRDLIDRNVRLRSGHPTATVTPLPRQYKTYTNRASGEKPSATRWLREDEAAHEVSAPSFRPAGPKDGRTNRFRMVSEAAMRNFSSIYRTA